MRILLVEDHRDIAANIAEYFGARGDSVAISSTGKAGLDLALGQRFDAIVLDIMLPDIDGLTVCRQLRNAADHTPILMLTAKDLLSDKIAGFEAGADDYLVKPFSLLELSARLTALTRRLPSPVSGPAPAHPIVVGNLKFDVDTLEASRDGQPIKLNPTTRRILLYLMQNTHRVVSREELEQLLWGAPAPSSDVLRAHMHALRAALDKHFEGKLLHTIHGTGYRLAMQNEIGS